MLVSIGVEDLTDMLNVPPLSEQWKRTCLSYNWENIPELRKLETVQRYMTTLGVRDPLHMSFEKAILLLHVTLAHAAPIWAWKVVFPNILLD